MKKILSVVFAGILAATSFAFGSSRFAFARSELPTAAYIATSQATQDLSKQLDDYFIKLTNSVGFSGSVLIARDGKVLLSKGYGMADLEHDVQNKPQTKFRLASITKQFTAMAILILQSQGKLNVQDHICKYLDRCPTTWESVTIHHLLTHTSGIPDYSDLQVIRDFKLKPHVSGEIIDLIREMTLGFKPGTRWAYNNSNYAILGAIIEKASGTGYAPFLRKSVFEPLKMSATGYDTFISVLKNRATGYVNNSIKADYINMTTLNAAGALYSTVEDLYLWDQALYTEKLVPKKLLDEMFKPHVETNVIPDESYGYGWVLQKQLGRRVIEHGGGMEGFSAEIMRFPDERVTVIVLCNREGLAAYEFATGAAKLVFGEA